MTYFLAVAAPTEQTQIAAAFDDPLYVEDASDSPIGAATLGNKDGAVLLVNAGHGASHIVAKRHDADRQVVDGVRRLLEKTPSVSILLHLVVSSWKNPSPIEDGAASPSESFRNYFQNSTRTCDTLW